MLDYERLSDLYPDGFWLGYGKPSGDATVLNYSELRVIARAFRRWALRNPNMPRTVGGNTELFEAFKRGWLEEKAQESYG